jgi:hypothetical protein
MSYLLPSKIINLSISKNWDDAKREWSIKEVFIQNNNCLCGHEIKENILIENKLNGNKAIIGNCCINKFFENKKYNKVFKALLKKKINRLILDTSLERKIITEKEYKFACDVWRKRNLTLKQKEWINYIKEKIFRIFVL